jgi:alpha-tubulin suppressor-like RCC1 family protein
VPRRARTLALLLAVLLPSGSLLGLTGMPAASAATLATMLSTGTGDGTCALTIAGGVTCWGSNSFGQLGNGTVGGFSSVPVDVSGLASGVAAVSVGYWSACALTTAGGVKCWGDGQLGDLGNGTLSSSSVPVNVSGLSSGVAAISAGFHGGCALMITGGVKCWGDNGHGQLGNGTTQTRLVPGDVTGLTSGVAQVSQGMDDACALMIDGSVKCWGYNGDGELGNGTTSADVLTPVDVVGLPAPVASISASSYHSCVVTTAGAAMCWGSNLFHQLGNGTNIDSSVPVRVSRLSSGVSSISATPFGTCALTTGGGVKCWGANDRGQLGTGDERYRAVPVDVLGLTGGVAEVSSGTEQTCALTTAGGVRCWGYNGGGDLGDGTTTDRHRPVRVIYLPGVEISGLAPGQGAVGTEVTITGKNLAGATGVLFNGATASFSVVSKRVIVATVPTGATTGPITIATPGGTTTSVSTFVVT